MVARGRPGGRVTSGEAESQRVGVLVVVEAEDGGAAEEGVVHVDVAGVVVGVGVPQAPGAHPHLGHRDRSQCTLGKSLNRNFREQSYIKW